MADNYQILIHKLDSFIRKYYKNLIIKGLIYSVALLVLTFILITLLEYFAWLDTTGRTIIFYTYLVICVLIITKLIIIPVFKLFRIGKIISHKQAAAIIGKHFNDVEDKLLNTLQLKELSVSSKDNSSLIDASIDQRILSLKPIPFSNAVDFKGNRKYLKYAIPPVVLVGFFLLAAPRIITEPTSRIINHSEYFEKAAPFSFVIENDNLTAIQQEDFELKLKIEGESAPESVTLVVGKSQFRMKKKNNIRFTHTFRNLQKDIHFHFEAEGFKSEKFAIKVLPKPIILNFVTAVQYPDYTNKQNEKLQNTGDLIVPEGTSISWTFLTKDTDELSLTFADSSIIIDPEKENSFNYTNQFFNSVPYSISSRNKFSSSSSRVGVLKIIFCDRDDLLPLIASLSQTSK